MATSKSLSLITLAIFVGSASAWYCDPWSAAIQRDIDGIGMGGSSEWNLDQCKTRCINEYGCQTAQFAEYGSYSYQLPDGSVLHANCFLYANQNFNRPQLQVQTGWGYFNSYKQEECQQNVGTWSNWIYRDIQGTGLGGTWEYDLAACKQRCAHTDFCQAAQFITGRLYYNSCNAYGHSGCNCFIYTNQNDNKVPGADIPDFYLYKYYPNGNSNRRRWSRRLGERTDNAVVTV